MSVLKYDRRYNTAIMNLNPESISLYRLFYVIMNPRIRRNDIPYNPIITFLLSYFIIIISRYYSVRKMVIIGSSSVLLSEKIDCQKLFFYIKKIRIYIFLIFSEKQTDFLISFWWKIKKFFISPQPAKSYIFLLW